jgi:hypothetical protein
MIIRLAVGALLLVLGRRLFWLFVAAVGFAAGWTAATDLLRLQPEWLALVIAVAAGLLGAALATFVQKTAVGLAGFLAGAFLASGLATMLSLPSAPWAWIAFIVGGILGAVLLGAAFEWALIGLSSLSGAMLIANALDLSSTLHLLVLLGLFVVGVIIQSALRKGSTEKPG